MIDPSRTAQWPRPLRLHLGGTIAKEGWIVLNAQPGPAVNIVGDISDLSMFPDASVAQIYASHVLEHVSGAKLMETLGGFRRVLMPGGTLMISVPDLEILARLLIDPELALDERVLLINMIYGGHQDEWDVHHFGFTQDVLVWVLGNLGFVDFLRYDNFGLFHDDSTITLRGTSISLNIACRVPD